MNLFVIFRKQIRYIRIHTFLNSLFLNKICILAARYSMSVTLWQRLNASSSHSVVFVTIAFCVFPTFYLLFYYNTQKFNISLGNWNVSSFFYLRFRNKLNIMTNALNFKINSNRFFAAEISVECRKFLNKLQLWDY